MPKVHSTQAKVGDKIDPEFVLAKPHQVEDLVRQLDGRFRVRRPGTPQQIKRNK